jgi:hypothetical protein
MHCVQRADRFLRKFLSRGLVHVLGHPERRPSLDRLIQHPERGHLLGRAHPSADSGAQQAAATLDRSDAGCDHIRSFRQLCDNFVLTRFAKEPREHCGRFRVQKGHVPRSSSMSRRAVPFGDRSGDARYVPPGLSGTRSCPLAASRANACCAGVAATPPEPGCRSSATTRPRSVTRNTSPAATERRV